MNKPRITVTKQAVRKIIEKIRKARSTGDIRVLLRAQALLGIAQGLTYDAVASLLQITAETVSKWVNQFAMIGLGIFQFKKSPGRPAKLTKEQKEDLREIITKGPQEAGFPGACWRSPMIQQLILDRYGAFFSVFYIAQLLKNMDLSFQKAKFVSDHLDEERRKDWLQNTWPEILKLSEEKNALILFGDEASFPQWGSLSYTWAPRGQQPVVKTSGKRKGYKVFGLIDYFTGRFFYKTTEHRLTSESYAEFLKEVLRKTTKNIILVQDGAKYHTSKMMKKFFQENSSRITVYQLPSYSPDYNPIEKLWKKIKQDNIHMHYFPTFDSLIEKVEEAMLKVKSAKEEVLKLFQLYDDLYQKLAA